LQFGSLAALIPPGETAYEFQRLNASYGAAPSLDTLRKRIKDIVGEPLCRCGFSAERFAGAVAHFDRLGYTANAFLLVNDATSLLPALGHVASTDEVLGYAFSDDELGLCDVRAGESLRAFLDRMEGRKLASQVEIVLLVPLVAGLAPYVLGAFAQAGPPTKETVRRRLQIARDEMEKRGAFIVAWAADAASAHYKLMRELRAAPAPGAPAIELLVPTLQGKETTVRLPARDAVINGKSVRVPVTPISDPVHLANLFRNAPLRKNAAMEVGDYQINLLALRDRLVQQCSALGMEHSLGVRHSDWEVSDRMNYAAAQRLFNTTLLEHVEREFWREPNLRGACGRAPRAPLLTTPLVSRRHLLLAARQPSGALLSRPRPQPASTRRVRILCSLRHRGVVHGPQGAQRAGQGAEGGGAQGQGGAAQG
jgi:hypothetical protein